MSFPTTSSIMRRVEAALSYDLLGGYDPQNSEEESADADVNGHLSSPLTDGDSVERVERYVIDPVGAGDLYAHAGRSGMTVGYSFGQQVPGNLRSGSGQAMHHIMPVEITCIRVVDSMEDIIGGVAGYDIDDVMDDVMRIMQSGRRDATKFGNGIQTVSLEPVQKLEGGTADTPWMGRILTIHFQRNLRDLQ